MSVAATYHINSHLLISHSSPLPFIFCLSPSPVTVRYQKIDGRFGTTSFNHASLADGRDHHVMLHASGLQRGPPRLNIYLDCRLVHTLNDLPAAFGSLPPGSNMVALRTIQSTGQVNKMFTVERFYFMQQYAAMT